LPGVGALHLWTCPQAALLQKGIPMKKLFASMAALALLTTVAQAQDVGVGVHVGGVGAGASVGTNGVGAGAHVGTVGAGVGVGVHPAYRVCHGGWYWHNHHHYCRRW
jgi:hypothetical protein